MVEDLYFTTQKNAQQFQEKQIECFHNFLSCGSTFLCKKHVSLVASTTDPSELEWLFKLARFYECVGSYDATHVGMLNCHSWAAINY